MPHEMPAGADETVPAPLPPLFTLSAYWVIAKLAVTVTAAVTVTLHVPVPEQPPPDQPLNVKPRFGVAVSVMVSP